MFYTLIKNHKKTIEPLWTIDAIDPSLSDKSTLNIKRFFQTVSIPDSQNYQNASKIKSFIKFISNILLNSFTFNNSSSLWDSLSSCSPVINNLDSDLVKFIYSVCLNKNLKDSLAPFLPRDELEELVIDYQLKNMIYCSLHFPDLQVDLYKHFSGVLSSEASKEYIQVELYIAIIEGLGILSKYNKSLEMQILNDLVKFLSEPSRVFIDLCHEDSSVLRECVCVTIATCCMVMIFNLEY